MKKSNVSKSSSSKRVIKSFGQSRNRSLSSFFRNRSWTGFQKRWISPNMPVQMRRQCLDATVLIDSAGTLQALDYAGNTPTWISLSAYSNDIGSPITPVQFGGTLSPTFKDTIQSNELVALWNEYCLEKVEVKMELLNGDSYQPSAGGSQNSSIPEVWYAYDPNDASVSADFVDTAKWANVRNHMLTNGNPLITAYTPKVAIGVYNGIATSGYGYLEGKAKLWMDINSSSVPQYALKFFFRNFGGTTSGCRVRITPTLYFSVRRMR